MNQDNQELHYVPVFDDPDKYWATFDLAISSTAKCLGYRLVHIDREKHPNKVLFIFQKTDDLLSFVDDFYSDHLSCNPRQLFEEHKQLKNRLYASE